MTCNFIGRRRSTPGVPCLCRFGNHWAAQAPTTKATRCWLGGDPVVLGKRKRVQTEASIVYHQSNWFVVNPHYYFVHFLFVDCKMQPTLVFCFGVILFLFHVDTNIMCDLFFFFFA